MTTTITSASTFNGTGAYYATGSFTGPASIGSAVWFKGSTATLTNHATIASPSAGGGEAVYFLNAGILTNLSAGYIHGQSGGVNAVRFHNSAGTIVNYGKIVAAVAANSAAINLQAGGVVTNKSSGLISGQLFSTNVAPVSVYNSGTIQGASGGGLNYGAIVLAGGGSVTNFTGGHINANVTGAYGIKIYGGAGTVTNAGTIDGGGGNAVDLYGAGTNELIVDAGASFVGNVVNTAGSTGIILLASGASTGTLSGGLGTEYLNFPTVSFASGAKWVVTAPAAHAASYTFDGFNPTDTIDVTGFTATSLTTLAGGTGVVLNSAASHVTLHFGASISSFGFTTGAFGTDITTVCFCKGTQILTPAGEVGVESLAVGDLVVTKGAAEPRRITWIGKGQVLATRGQRGLATPVIVRKGALSPNVPNRDLHVTKAHSLYFDGVFVPVEFLVNHRSIVWDDRAQEVEIYHVELESHDVLIANGAPAESYRDDGNRWLFQNANDGWNGAPQEPYAPVLTGGLVVDLIWERLLDRAGPRQPVPMTDDADLHLVVDGVRLGASEIAGDLHVFFIPGMPGSVEIASRDVVPAEWGIARDPRALGVAVRKIELHRGGAYVAVATDDPRLADGVHAFEAEGGIRWTNGRATLSPEVLAVPGRGALKLVLTLGGATRYPDFGDAVAVA
jgi:hypothetical protein